MRVLPLRPSASLVGAAAALLPLWLLPLADAALGQVTLLVCLCLALVVVVDAGLSWGRLGDVRVESSERVRGSKGQPFTLRASLAGARTHLRGVTLTPMLPPTLALDAPLPPPAALPPGERLTCGYSLSGSTRGALELEHWLLEARSLLGLLLLRRVVQVPVSIRIYPAIRSDMRKLSPLLLSRSMLGAHHIRMLGKGREFEKLRDYVPGDSAEDIHWKATARRGSPITKTFQIERTQDIYVLIDHSRLSGAVEPGGEPVLDRFLAAATVLGMVLQRQNDRMGIVTFADTVTTFLRARAGLRQLTAALDTLYALPVRDVSPDFAELATTVHTRLRRRSLLILLTDLRDPVAAERLTLQMKLLARKHHVLVLSIRSSEAAPLFSGEPVQTEDEIYRRVEGHIVWRSLAGTSVALRAAGATVVTADSPRLAIELVDAYLRARKRQVL